MREYFRAMGVLSLAAAATCWSGAAFGAVIPVSNPGFDVLNNDGSGLIADERFIDGSDGLSLNEIIYLTATGQPANELGAFSPTGWQTVLGPGLGFQTIGAIRNDATLAVPTGTLGFIATQNDNNGNPLGSAFTQDVGVTVQPNTIYTLTVNVSDANNFPTNDIIGLSPVIEVDLLAGTTFLPDTDVFVRPLNGLTTTYTSTVVTGSSVPAGNLTIRLFAAGAADGFAGTVTLFDDVTLTSSVIPEPASLSLLGLTAVAGIAVVRKRRTAQRDA